MRAASYDKSGRRRPRKGMAPARWQARHTQLLLLFVASLLYAAAPSGERARGASAPSFEHWLLQDRDGGGAQCAT